MPSNINQYLPPRFEHNDPGSATNSILGSTPDISQANPALGHGSVRISSAKSMDPSKRNGVAALVEASAGAPIPL